jgi:hypothetical protein
MKITNKKIFASFRYCLKNYNEIEKSDHWKKYDDRLSLYKSKYLKNFRNNSLSKGLDDDFSKKEISNLYTNLNLDEKKLLIKNYGVPLAVCTRWLSYLPPELITMCCRSAGLFLYVRGSLYCSGVKQASVHRGV